jgi:pyruvate-formate lyase-activating enzyme
MARGRLRETRTDLPSRLRDAATALVWRLRAELTLRARRRPWWEPAALEHSFAALWKGQPWTCTCRVCDLARSGGWTPTERTWRFPRRLRLATLFGREDPALRLSWPCDIDAFWSVFLARRPPPIPLAEGWSLDGLACDRVNRAVLASVRSEEGVEFRVVIEPRSEFRALATTRLLSLSAADVPSGVDQHHVVRPLVEALAALLSAADARAEPGDLDAIFGRPDADARAFRGVELRINRDCNERCIFCNTPEDADRILEDPAEVFAQIDREFVRGYRRITFTGRETTLDPSLVAYITRARRRGYADIEIQTNATTLARRRTLTELVAAGLTTVHISLHTFDPRTFEVLVGPARLLEKTLTGIDHVAATKRLRCNILCVITAHNLDELPAFIDAVAARWGERIAFVLLSPMAPMGDGAGASTRCPRWGRCGPCSSAPSAARGTSACACASPSAAACRCASCRPSSMSATRSSPRWRRRPSSTTRPSPRSAPTAASTPVAAACGGATSRPAAATRSCPCARDPSISLHGAVHFEPCPLSPGVTILAPPWERRVERRIESRNEDARGGGDGGGAAPGDRRARPGGAEGGRGAGGAQGHRGVPHR